MTEFARVLGSRVEPADLWKHRKPCELHGVPIKDCLLCTKLAGECDWGVCTRKADRTMDGRPTCPGCVPLVQSIIAARGSRKGAA